MMVLIITFAIKSSFGLMFSVKQVVSRFLGTMANTPTEVDGFDGKGVKAISIIRNTIFSSIIRHKHIKILKSMLIINTFFSTNT